MVNWAKGKGQLRPGTLGQPCMSLCFFVSSFWRGYAELMILWLAASLYCCSFRLCLVKVQRELWELQKLLTLDTLKPDAHLLVGTPVLASFSSSFCFTLFSLTVCMTDEHLYETTVVGPARRICPSKRHCECPVYCLLFALRPGVYRIMTPEYRAKIILQRRVAVGGCYQDGSEFTCHHLLHIQAPIMGPSLQSPFLPEPSTSWITTPYVANLNYTPSFMKE